MLSFLNGLAYIGAIAGALILVIGVGSASGAPQEAAVAAIAVTVAFVPYALARIAGAAHDRKLLEQIARGGRAE